MFYIDLWAFLYSEHLEKCFYRKVMHTGLPVGMMFKVGIS